MDKVKRVLDRAAKKERVTSGTRESRGQIAQAAHAEPTPEIPRRRSDASALGSIFSSGGEYSRVEGESSWFRNLYDPLRRGESITGLKSGSQSRSIRSAWSGRSSASQSSQHRPELVRQEEPQSPSPPNSPPSESGFRSRSIRSMLRRRSSASQISPYQTETGQREGLYSPYPPISPDSPRSTPRDMPQQTLESPISPISPSESAVSFHSGYVTPSERSNRVPSPSLKNTSLRSASPEAVSLAKLQRSLSTKNLAEHTAYSRSGDTSPVPSWATDTFGRTSRSDSYPEDNGSPRIDEVARKPGFFPRASSISSQCASLSHFGIPSPPLPPWPTTSPRPNVSSSSLPSLPPSPARPLSALSTLPPLPSSSSSLASSTDGQVYDLDRPTIERKESTPSLLLPARSESGTAHLHETRGLHRKSLERRELDSFARGSHQSITRREGLDLSRSERSASSSALHSPTDVAHQAGSHGGFRRSPSITRFTSDPRVNPKETFGKIRRADAAKSSREGFIDDGSESNAKIRRFAIERLRRAERAESAFKASLTSNRPPTTQERDHWPQRRDRGSRAREYLSRVTIRHKDRPKSGSWPEGSPHYSPISPSGTDVSSVAVTKAPSRLSLPDEEGPVDSPGPSHFTNQQKEKWAESPVQGEVPEKRDGSPEFGGERESIHRSKLDRSLTDQHHDATNRNRDGSPIPNRSGKYRRDSLKHRREDDSRPPTPSEESLSSASEGAMRDFDEEYQRFRRSRDLGRSFSWMPNHHRAIGRVARSAQAKMMSALDSIGWSRASDKLRRLSSRHSPAENGTPHTADANGTDGGSIISDQDGSDLRHRGPLEDGSPRYDPYERDRSHYGRYSSRRRRLTGSVDEDSRLDSRSTHSSIAYDQRRDHQRDPYRYSNRSNADRRYDDYRPRTHHSKYDLRDESRIGFERRRSYDRSSRDIVETGPPHTPTQQEDVSSGSGGENDSMHSARGQGAGARRERYYEQLREYRSKRESPDTDRSTHLDERLADDDKPTRQKLQKRRQSKFTGRPRTRSGSWWSGIRDPWAGSKSPDSELHKELDNRTVEDGEDARSRQEIRPSLSYEPLTDDPSPSAFAETYTSDARPLTQSGRSHGVKRLGMFRRGRTARIQPPASSTPISREAQGEGSTDGRVSLGSLASSAVSFLRPGSRTDRSRKTDLLPLDSTESDFKSGRPPTPVVPLTTEAIQNGWYTQTQVNPRRKAAEESMDPSPLSMVQFLDGTESDFYRRPTSEDDIATWTRSSLGPLDVNPARDTAKFADALTLALGNQTARRRVSRALSTPLERWRSTAKSGDTIDPVLSGRVAPGSVPYTDHPIDAYDQWQTTLQDLQRGDRRAGINNLSGRPTTNDSAVDLTATVAPTGDATSLGDGTVETTEVNTSVPFSTAWLGIEGWQTPFSGWGNGYRPAHDQAYQFFNRPSYGPVNEPSYNQGPPRSGSSNSDWRNTRYGTDPSQVWSHPSGPPSNLWPPAHPTQSFNGNTYRPFPSRYTGSSWGSSQAY